MRLIDADALILDLEYDIKSDQELLDYGILSDDRRELIQFDKDCKQNTIWTLNDTTTAEPERDKGRWVFVRKVSPVYNYQGVKLWGNEYRCSCCGYRDMAIENFKSCAFCPNCGAKMEG